MILNTKRCEMLDLYIYIHIYTYTSSTPKVSTSKVYSRVTHDVKGLWIWNNKWGKPTTSYNWGSWGADRTSHFWHHMSPSPVVIMWKVVGQHLILNIIPNNFTVGIRREVCCCEWGMSWRNNRLKFKTSNKTTERFYGIYPQTNEGKPKDCNM